jgi:hypothetical protein
MRIQEEQEGRISICWMQKTADRQASSITIKQCAVSGIYVLPDGDGKEPRSVPMLRSIICNVHDTLTDSLTIHATQHHATQHHQHTTTFQDDGPTTAAPCAGRAHGQVMGSMYFTWSPARDNDISHWIHLPTQGMDPNDTNRHGRGTLGFASYFVCCLSLLHMSHTDHSQWLIWNHPRWGQIQM